jgi:hypothetical protein
VLQLSQALSDTGRGAGGYGSTGTATGGSPVNEHRIPADRKK